MRKKFSEMTQKELRQARNDLVKYLREETDLRPSRVTNLTDNGCFIEGGTFPAIYDHSSLTLKIWGRGNRYSGGQMSVKQLKQVEDKMVAWFLIYDQNREEENE